MDGRILVTGGTGTLGRLLVPQLMKGRPVRVLSRRGSEGSDGVGIVKGDLASGEGIEAAVAGVDTIVHCAGSAKGDEVKARNLMRAATRAGVAHVVYISVVGADRIPIVSAADRMQYGYFQSKFAAEQLIAASGVPFTTVRATQFHDLVFAVAQQMAKLPVLPAPAVAFQPIDARDVADRLAELAFGEPAGLVKEMGGPRVYTLADLMRSYLQATGRRRPVLPVWQPGKAARAFRAGANLTPENASGRRTWEEFLAERAGVPVR